MIKSIREVGKIKTIYIDVYFLINFTVDLLAIYFSSVLSKIKCGIRRMIIASIVGGSYAVLAVLLFDSSAFMYPISVLILIIIVCTVAYRVSVYRKLKYAVSFILFQLLIGGAVYYGYCALSALISLESINAINGTNKKLLILALLVLLAIGMIKLILAFFGNVKSEVSVTLDAFWGGKHLRFDALVDSGNLAKDPFDKKPVVLITLNEARKLIALPQSVNDYDKLTENLKRRIRIIPITRGRSTVILYGIKPDKTLLVKGNRNTEIEITLAIDTEEGDYGGYPALIPLSCLEDLL